MPLREGLQINIGDCHGILVARRLVLTAGFCVTKTDSTEILTDVYVQSLTDPQKRLRASTNASKMNNDLALVGVDEDITTTPATAVIDPATSPHELAEHYRNCSFVTT